MEVIADRMLPLVQSRPTTGTRRKLAGGAAVPHRREPMTSDTQQPGLRERKKQRTRELIADTARELFFERGFDAVTVAEIAREAQVFARFTASLAEAIADETSAHPSEVTPWVVANALIGVHRSLIDYVRRETLADTPNRKLARDVRAQAKRALAALGGGLAD